MVCAAAIAVAPATAGAQPPKQASAAVLVVFEGNGTATVDQNYVGPGGSCSTHDVMSLAWVATFKTRVEDGQLQPTTGALGAVGPGNLALTVGGPCADPRVGGGNCTAGISAGAGAPVPALVVSGGDPAHVEAQSLSGPLTFSGCGGAAQTPFAGSDLSVLSESLPNSLTAVAQVPAAGGNLTIPVSSATAPGQIASSCLGTGRHGTGDTSCSASLTWSGTLHVSTTPCEQTWYGAGPTNPDCVTPEEKEVAERKLALGFKLLGKPLYRGKGQLGSTIALRAEGGILVEQSKDVAADPPVSSFTTIAHPKPLRAPHMPPAPKQLRGFLLDLEKVAGGMSVVATSVNRANGAFVATETDPSADAWTQKQNHAAEAGAAYGISAAKAALKLDKRLKVLSHRERTTFGLLIHLLKGVGK